MIYPLLAKTILYPTQDYAENIQRCLAALSQKNKDLADLFKPFAEEIAKMSSHDLEELFIRTFDIQALCYLEVGYVLFGEDYKRGHFLVKMQELQRKYDNDCGVELSDHLTNILTLLPKMTASEEAREEAHDMVEKLVLPALQKMLLNFSKGGNIYQHVLKTIESFLRSEFNCTHTESETKPRDVLHYDSSLELPAYNPSVNPWDIWREP